MELLFLCAMFSLAKFIGNFESILFQNKFIGNIIFMLFENIIFLRFFFNVLVTFRFSMQQK